MGKTGSTGRQPRGLWKHPHARGEDLRLSCLSSSVRETPPRTWGRRLMRVFAGGDERNTPTHVGKTTDDGGRSALSWKHPHARGEDQRGHENPYIELETPPRTWGRRNWGPEPSREERNTPTHVGKTNVTSGGAYIAGKHPHARGEDARSTIKKYPVQGNTPTHVGKTRLITLRGKFSEKHPHARGED